MTNTITASEYRRLMDQPEAGALPDMMDLSGERQVTDCVVVSITGMPAYAISPNSRKHWAVRAREGLDLKHRTIIACQDQSRVSGPVQLFWSIFAAKSRKPMDRDNAIATLKPAMDGLVRAGIIDGDTPNIVTGIDVKQYPFRDHHNPGGIIVVTITRSG